MSDGENLLQTIKTVIHDVVAPDVRELKVKVDALDKRINSVETNLREQISTLRDTLPNKAQRISGRF